MFNAGLHRWEYSVILTHEALRDELGWDAALHLRIPPAPDFHLLEAARRHLITHLNWIRHDLARGPPPDESRRKIHHAAARLREISHALQGLLGSDNSDDVRAADDERASAPVAIIQRRGSSLAGVPGDFRFRKPA